MLTTPDLSPLGAAAVEYAKRGWAVFPLLPESKEPLISKRMGGRGFLDATTDLQKITNWWRVTPNANIGLSLIHSGLVCVDADTYRPECEWASFIAGRDLPATLVQQSARGGTHYIFTAPQTTDFPAHLCKFVDIKHKGYIVLEPSIFEGAVYSFQTDDDPAPAPDWLLSAKPHVPERQSSSATVTVRTADPRVLAYCQTAIAQELGVVANAPDGTRNNTLNAAAFNIGQIVGAGLADRDDMAAALSEAASHWPNPAKTAGTIASGLTAGMATPRAFPMDDEPPFDPTEMQKVVDAIWSSFERRGDKSREEAISDAIKEITETQTPMRDLWQAMPSFPTGSARRKYQEAIMPTSAEFERLIPKDPGSFPISSIVRGCPGLLGQLADFIDAASPTATEAGAIAVAIPLLGAIMGRAYRTETNLRTNVYTVALGGSGSGKTSLVSPAKELLTLAKMTNIIGSDRIASGSGLLKMLSGNTPKVCFLDEFGHMLKQIGAPGAGSHSKQIITEFTALYSAANTLFTGTAYATNPPDPIDSPHLCLFGMATPDQFWDAFGSSAMEDGSIARYLIFPIGKSGPKDPDMRFQSEIVDAMEGVANAVGSRVRGNLGIAQICQAEMSAGAEKARQSLIRTMTSCAEYAEANGVKGGSAILRRVAENAYKIALISAVGVDPVAPKITDADFAIGHALARWSATSMIANIASHIADNQYERDVNAVERRIEAAGKDGILQGKLNNDMRAIRKRDFEEIIAGLLDGGVIFRSKTDSKKPGSRVFHRKYLQDQD
jgi:hypothetical protein